MAFGNSQPQNFNLLQRNNYKIVINRLPATLFYTQTLKTPEVFFPPIEVPSPFIQLNYAASQLKFSNLEFDFKVDENMQNYREIFTWMQGLGSPEDNQQYIDLKYTNNKDKNKGLRSDISVQVITSSNIPNKEMYFRDCFPVSLSGLSFETRNLTVNYLSATVKFSIRDFIISDVIS